MTSIDPPTLPPSAGPPAPHPLARRISEAEIEVHLKAAAQGAAMVEATD